MTVCLSSIIESRREKQRLAYSSNPDVAKARSARYRKDNPDKVKSAAERYRAANRERILDNAKVSKLLVKVEAFEAYGGFCQICGEDHLEFLCLDHINNDGKADREAGRGGFNLYRYLRSMNWPLGYRVLCHNCNFARFLAVRIAASTDAVQARYSRKVKSEVITAYGGRCSCCGETNPLVLDVDHVLGDGKLDREANRRGRVFYVYLRKLGYPKDRYRLLCHNCNMAIGVYGYCPHSNEDMISVPGNAIPNRSRQ